MKQTYLLFALCSFIGINVSAQHFNLKHNAQTKSITVQNESNDDSDFIEIGYCTGKEIYGATRVDAGENKVYIQFPQAALSRLAGNRLTKVMIGFDDIETTTAELLLSKTKEGTPFYTQTIAITPNAWNEVVLDTPYAIDGSEFFIGYAVTPASATDYPIALDSSAAHEYGGWVLVSGSWLALLGTNMPFNLAMYGVVEGETLPAYDVELSTVELPITQVSPHEEFSMQGTFTTHASKKITSIEVSYTIGQNNAVVQTIDGLELINSIGNNSFTIDNITVQEEGILNVHVEITKINGHADEDSSDNTASSKVYVSSESLPTQPSIVTTENTQKLAVIEEYTGINCSFCPLGHKAANSVLAAYPDQAIAINIHQGVYAYMGASYPDYRTEWGDALANLAGINQYPQGTINRHVFKGSSTAVAHSYFLNYSKQIMAMDSYVNLAVKTKLNKERRELIMDVEMYYTDNSPEASNMLNIVLLQDSVLGYQNNAASYPPMFVNGQYQHNHMLRDMITKQWGDSIKQTEAGTFVARRYFYVVPEKIRGIDVNVDKIEVAAFIAEGKQEIITGASHKPEQFVSGINETEVSGLGAYVQDGMLRIVNPNHVAISQINIYNIAGQSVLSTTYARSPILLTDLQAGIYITDIQTEKGNTTLKIRL